MDMDPIHLAKTPSAERKARQRARAQVTYNAKPRTLWLSEAEKVAVHNFLTRRYGHDGNLGSRRTPAAVATKITPASPCVSQRIEAEQLSLFSNVACR